MIARISQALRRFRRGEDGAVVLIEFVILFPVIFGMFLASVEVSLYSLRQFHLNRGLETAVRYIRLNTRTTITHDMIKTMICDNVGYIGDCKDTLRLEMVLVNPRNFAAMNASPDCVDKSLPVKQERGFTLGAQHQLMLLRACVKFDPMLPGSAMGFKFDTDGAGQGSMYAVSSFVQEPS